MLRERQTHREVGAHLPAAYMRLVWEHHEAHREQPAPIHELPRRGVLGSAAFHGQAVWSCLLVLVLQCARVGLPPTSWELRLLWITPVPDWGLHRVWSVELKSRPSPPEALAPRRRVVVLRAVRGARLEDLACLR